MIKNYFKIAWRNMQRSKANSFINIAGLAIGMTCVILITLYVQDELRYDKFFKSADHIFQVNMTAMNNGVASGTGGNTAPKVGPTLVNSFPEIETFARIYRPGDVLVRNEGKWQNRKLFLQNGMYWPLILIFYRYSILIFCTVMHSVHCNNPMQLLLLNKLRKNILVPIMQLVKCYY
ncbi:MAG: ABC transporter permease [Ferruginibacter sp.]